MNGENVLVVAKTSEIKNKINIPKLSKGLFLNLLYFFVKIGYDRNADV